MTKINQNFTMWSGDDKELVFSVFDASGCPAILAGASGWWVLSNDDSSASLIRKSSDDGQISLSGSLFTVTLAASDTDALCGYYYHEAQLRDSASKISTIAVGQATINRDVIV